MYRENGAWRGAAQRMTPGAIAGVRLIVWRRDCDRWVEPQYAIAALSWAIRRTRRAASKEAAAIAKR